MALHIWASISCVDFDDTRDDWKWCFRCGTLCYNDVEFFQPGKASLNAEGGLVTVDGGVEPECWPPPPKVDLPEA